MRTKRLIPIHYEAPRAGSPKILSGKGSIPCSGERKMVSVGCAMRTKRLIPIHYEGPRPGSPKILSGKGSIPCSGERKMV